MQKTIFSTSTVVPVDSTISKIDLYINALSWFTKTNTTILIHDVGIGKIVGKRNIDDMDVTISLMCKDGKYKSEIEFLALYDQKINLDIHKFGMYYGKTTASFTNDKLVSVKFKYDDYEWPLVYDNGDGKPMGMDIAFKEWKQSVDLKINEIRVKGRRDLMLQELNEELNEDIKLAMSKKSDW